MKAVIIGGGIIGLSSAFYLSEAGWEVEVIEAADFTDNCSYGNLGMIVPSHFVPLAAPGIVAQGIRWMFNSSSPFYIRPALDPKLINWGLKFLRSANAKQANAAARPLLELNLFSKSLYEELATKMNLGLGKKGILMYFKTEAVAEEEHHLAEKARAMGLDVVYLNKQEVLHLEPEQQPDVLGAVHYRCDAHLHPNSLMREMINVLKQKGVRLSPEMPLQKIVRNQDQISEIIAGGETIKADLFVMASGSWLPETMKQAGITIPLMPGKGYSFTGNERGPALNIPAILCEARVAITPMAGGLRFGGTMELSGFQHKVNMNRVRGIVESVPRYFPAMKLEMPQEQEVWYGFRPCSPDGLPYIGYAKNCRNLLVAGGHAMMGLSLGPATGKLIAELAQSQSTSVDIKAFDPNRFS
ncbi:MAG: FAD-dependent oxidoreductase [Flavipsychrobacter sp.]|nr:FAD-dependent oxidoreductase [Flavipsychrobacter sp.]